MKQTKSYYYKIITLFIFCFCYSKIHAQAYNDDKILMIENITRIYNEEPFEGVKVMKADKEGIFNYVIAITLSNNIDLDENNSTIATSKAKETMQISYLGPFIKFEILTTIANETNNTITYLFTCQLLSDFVKVAEKHFNDKKYDLALESYNYILLLDELNEYRTSEKIAQITELNNFFKKRSTSVFSYKSTNKNDLVYFQNQLLEDLNLKIEKKKKGYLNLNYLVSFDTLGNNLSEVKNISTSLRGYKRHLSKINSKGFLAPSIEQGFFLASQESLVLDAKWSRTKILFKSKSKGIFPKKKSDQNLNAVVDFINRQPFKYGKYFCEIKNKEVNGNSFTNINLVKYKTVGPGAVFLSMLMPGLGTLKVTYGKKGWGRFTCFLLSSGLAIGSKLYANAEYKKYLGATNQVDMNIYYNNANIGHKIALISGGLSTTIYLNDIIGVISKGAKNIKTSKALRQQLFEAPVIIQNQKISWE